MKIAVTGVSVAPAVAIAGVPCTGVSYASGIVTATAPAFTGGPNGSVVGQTITVTTSGGTASSSGPQQDYYYLPSNNAFVYSHRGDCRVTLATGVSILGDVSGNGNDWLESYGPAQPAHQPDYNGTGLSYLAFDGVSSVMALTLSGGTPSGDISYFWIGNYNATGGFYISQSMFGGNLYFCVDSGSYAVTSDFLTGTADTNPHSFGMLVSNTTAGTGLVDGTATTLSVGSFTTTVQSLLGTYDGVSFFANFNLLADIAYDGIISSGDWATVMGIMEAVGNT